jgi:hypothetical protein
MVSDCTAENPATPSNVAAVFAGADALLPDPLQPLETVKVLVAPFATNDLNALCKGKDKVDTTGPGGVELPPPPQPARPTNSKDAAVN